MFNIYMKGFNQNGRIINEETLVQTIPAEHEGDLKLISPIVKGEMGNAESFNFNIENGTKFYDAFRQMKTYIRVTYDGTTIFYGRVLTVDEGFHGTRKIRCEGPLSFLLDSAVEGIDEGNRKKVSTNEYLTSLLNNHNSILENDANRIFTIGEVPGNYSARVSVDQQIKNDSRKFGADGWTDTKGAIEDLRSHYGGYLRARLSGGIGSSIYLDWMDHYFNSSINSQTIEIGKNVIDLNTSMEIDNIFTAIVPIGNNHSSGSSSSSGTSGSSSTGAKHFYIPGKVLKVPDICAKYGDQLNSGYHRYEDYATAIAKYGLIIKTVSFDDAENKEQLYEKACEWIKNNYQGDVVRFTAKAIDLHQIGDSSVSKILVGDRVNIIYPSGSESGESTKKTISLTCMSIQYDLYNPENNQYTFGIPANIMTKSYGLHRQSQSNKTGSSGARSGGAMNTRSDEPSWLEEVKNWLINHTVYYDGVLPYKEGYSGMRKDIPMVSSSDNYFLNPATYGLDGDWVIYKFTAAPSAHMDDSYSLQELKRLQEEDQTGLLAEEYKRRHTVINKYDQSDHIRHGWQWQRMRIPPQLSYDIIIDYNIIPYVKDEYGYDLQTGLSVKMPSQYTRLDGTIVETGVDDTGNVVTKEMFDPDNPDHAHFVTGKDGKLISVQDSNGEWQYYGIDEDGEPYKTNVRDLKVSALEGEKEFGYLIKGNYIKSVDSQGNPTYFADTENMEHAYYFSQKVEKYKNGELVVARVDGDIVRIGSEATMYIEDLSRFSQVHIAGLYHWEKDENDVPRVVIDAGGGMRTRRYTLDPETGKPIIDPSGQYVMHESGIFDNDNLSAGVITGKFNDERTKQPEERAYLYADHVLVGTRPDGSVSKKLTLISTDEYTAGLVHVDSEGNPIMDAGTKIYRVVGGVKAAYGIWDSSGKNLDGGMMVDKINGQTTSYLLGDHIVIGKRPDGSVSKDVKLVATESYEAGLVHMENGDPILDAGTKIYRENGGIYYAYGIWDSSGKNLDGGLMVTKINNQTTATIKGDRVNIEGDTTVKGAFTVENGALVVKKTAVFQGNVSLTDANGYVQAKNFNVASGGSLRFIGSAAGEKYDLTATNIQGFIKSASVNGNVLTLTPVHGDAITFSKATTLTGAWGSGTDAETFIVTASPQGNTYKFSPPLRLDGTTANSNFSAQIYETPSGGTPVAKKSVYGYLIFNDSKASSTVTVNTKSDGSGSSVASISIGSLYTSGKTDGAASINISKGSWVSGVCSFTRTSSGGKTSDEVRLCYKWDGTDVQIWDGQSADAEHGSYTNYKIDVSGKLETKSITSNGTYTPSSGNIGFSSVSVNVPTGAGGDKARFNSGAGSYFIEAYENASGTSISGSSMNYQLKAVYEKSSSGAITSEVRICKTDGTRMDNTPGCAIWLGTAAYDENKYQGVLAYDTYYAITSGSIILAMWKTPEKASASYDLDSVSKAADNPFSSSDVSNVFRGCDDYKSVSLPAASTNNYRGIIMKIDGHKFGCYFSN